MLEGYLNQDEKVIPDLQQQANTLARQIMEGASENDDAENGDKTPRPGLAPTPNGPPSDLDLPTRSGPPVNGSGR